MDKRLADGMILMMSINVRATPLLVSIFISVRVALFVLEFEL